MYATKLKKATYYKYIVKAYKLVDGKKVITGTSVAVHSITKDGKYVKLRVIRYFNRINQLKSEELMDTWIKTDR